jgi:hypothetical protein
LNPSINPLTFATAKKKLVEKRTNVPSFATLKGKLCKQEKKFDLFFQH